MTEFAVTAKTILEFQRKRSPEEGLDYWADLADAVGGFLPFIVRREVIVDIPFERINLPRLRSADFVPKSGEIWVLFCFDEQDVPLSADSPIRSDGFPLILEWRKGMSDSPLLSEAFHSLADLVREQHGVRDWGLCPSFLRYGDKIAFTDSALFADNKDAVYVASAYGALTAGLSCAVSGKFPARWPFPTLQWDEKRWCIAGVGGLPRKFSVAANSGARVVTVAHEQLVKAKRSLEGLQRGPNGDLYADMRVCSVRDAWSPRVLARRIAFIESRVRRIIHRCVLALIVLLGIAGTVGWDATREVYEYYDSFCDVWGRPQGIDKLTRSAVAKRIQSYRFAYRGYGFCGVKPYRKLRRITCVNSSGYPVLKRNEELLNIVDGNAVSDVVDWIYEEQGHAVWVHGLTWTGSRKTLLSYDDEDGLRANMRIVNLSNSVLPQKIDCTGKDLFGDSVNFADAGSLAQEIVIARDAEGRVGSIRYRNKVGELLNQTGLLGYGRGVTSVMFPSRNADGRVQEVRFGNPDGFCSDRFGALGYRYQYVNGVLAEAIEFGVGKTNVCRLASADYTTGFPSGSVTFNGSITNQVKRYLCRGGRLLEDACTFADGSTALMRHVAFDEYGYPTRTEGYCDGVLSSVRCGSRCMENGKLIAMTNYLENAEGKRIPLRNGDHMEVYRFAVDGGWAEEAHYDEEGNLRDLPRLGRVRIRCYYGSNGKTNAVETIQCLNDDGVPVENKEGWCWTQTVSTLHPDGTFVIQSEHYDAILNLVSPIQSVDGQTAISRCSFLDGGTLLRLSYYGTRRETVECAAGYHRSDSVYSNGGKICRMRIYDCKNAPIAWTKDVNGHPIYVCGLENQGDVRVMAYWSDLRGGEKKDCESGWAELREKLENSGQVISKEYYNARGKRVKIE